MRRSRPFILLVLCTALLISACTTTATTATSVPAQQPPAAPAATQPPPTPTTAPTNTPAPSPTPQPTATPAPAQGGACLVGVTWQLSNMTDYFTSVMAQAGGGPKVASQDGTITYVFGNDGIATMEADNFKLTLQVDVQSVSLDIVVDINGRATANFTLSDPNEITLSNPKMGDLKFGATLNGQKLFASTPDEMAAMFGVSPDSKYNTVTYSCTGDTLMYTPAVKNAKPLIFKRGP
jgi:hypothetical protein